MIRLVTRADDAGSFVSANKAIRAAFERGILRNTSVLATGPALEDAAERLLPPSGKGGGLCFGLHATVTAEWEEPRWGPVLPREQVPTILDEDGMLHRQTAPLHEKDASPKEMLAEVAAQLERLRSLGFDVKYVDTHMGFAWLQGMEEGVPDLARREGLIYRPPVDRLPKVEGMSDSGDRASGLLAALGRAESGTYLVVGHPAFDDEEMRKVHGSGHEPGEIARARDAERLMFMREDVVKYCGESGVLPIRYDEI